MFSPVYQDRVIDAAYRNWTRLYEEEFWAVQRAHLVGLARTGILEADTASAIAAATDRLQATIAWPAQIPPGFEDMYFVFERELETLVGPERAAFLHTARSRNDMDNSIFRMALRKRLLDLSRRILDSLRAILDRARESDAELTILFTHGQPANVSTMGHFLSAIAGDLAEDLHGLLDSINAVDRSAMGACAITGTGFPLDRGLVAELLGFPGFVVNSYRAISSSHWLSKPAGALEELLLDLTRIAADILHKASSEVGLVSFPDELIQVSSIMPQKRNPVIIEHIRIQAGLAAATSTGLRSLLRNVPYQDVNEAADAPVSELIDSLTLAASAVDLAGEALVKMRSDEERARRIALDFGVTTTELADTLVREEKIGFRQAHAICSAFARSGGDRQLLRRSFEERCGRPMKLSPGEVEAALSPEGFVAVRKLPGGPAPEGMKPVHDELEESLDRAQSRAHAIESRVLEAGRRLDLAWAELHE
jgi:argininosuccinate lyase